MNKLVKNESNRGGFQFLSWLLEKGLSQECVSGLKLELKGMGHRPWRIIWERANKFDSYEASVKANRFISGTF